MSQFPTLGNFSVTVQYHTGFFTTKHNASLGSAAFLGITLLIAGILSSLYLLKIPAIGYTMMSLGSAILLLTGTTLIYFYYKHQKKKEPMISYLLTRHEHKGVLNWKEMQKHKFSYSDIIERTNSKHLYEHIVLEHNKGEFTLHCFGHNSMAYGSKCDSFNKSIYQLIDSSHFTPEVY